MQPEHDRGRLEMAYVRHSMFRRMLSMYVTRVDNLAQVKGSDWLGDQDAIHYMCREAPRTVIEVTISPISPCSGSH